MSKEADQITEDQVIADQVANDQVAGDQVIEQANQSLIEDDKEENNEIVDQNELDLKLKSSLRNQLIVKLNQFNEIMFDDSVDTQQKLSILKQNNRLTSILLNLPAFNLEDDHQNLKLLDNSKKVQICGNLNETQKDDNFEDIKIGDNPKEVQTDDNSKKVQIGDNSKEVVLKPVLPVLNRGKKYVEQLENLLAKLNKFDFADDKSEGISCWFKKYETFSGPYEWSDEEHVNAMSFFFDSKLEEVVYACQNLNCQNFKKFKKLLIDCLKILKCFKNP